MNIFCRDIFRLLTLSAAVCVQCQTYAADASNEPETFTVDLSTPGRPATLIIEESSMQITVEGENRDNMEFSIIKLEDNQWNGIDIIPPGTTGLIRPRPDRNASIVPPSDSRSGRDTQGLTRIDTRPGLSVEEFNNVVNFETEFSNAGYHVLVKVPVNTSVQLESFASTPLTVTGVEGAHELSNATQGIYASDISGSLVAETLSGEIVINMTEVTPNTPMAFSSFQGNIDLTLPPTYAADLSIYAGQGAIYTDFDVEMDDSLPRIENRQNNRRARMRITRETRGLLNEGGPTLRIESFTGDIYLRRGL